MKLMLISTTMILLTACGGQTHSVEFEAPEEDIISGQTYNHVIVRLDFIKELNALCEEATLISDFDTEELYNQEVASCTLESLNIVDAEAFSQFNNAVCDDPQSQDEEEICNSI